MYKRQPFSPGVELNTAVTQRSWASWSFSSGEIRFRGGAAVNLGRGLSTVGTCRVTTTADGAVGRAREGMRVGNRPDRAEASPGGAARSGKGTGVLPRPGRSGGHGLT